MIGSLILTGCYLLLARAGDLGARGSSNFAPTLVAVRHGQALVAEALLEVGLGVAPHRHVPELGAREVQEREGELVAGVELWVRLWCVCLFFRGVCESIWGWLGMRESVGD